MSSTVIPFQAEHQAANRLDGPVGREIARIGSDFEQLAAEYTERGNVDSHSIHMLRAGLDRLDAFGALAALREELEIQSRHVGRLISELGDDQDPHAVPRTQRRLDVLLAEIRSLSETKLA